MSRFSVPSSFTVPDTIEGVVGLLTARRWEKAAIVYAWTLPEGSGGRPKASKTTGFYNVEQFAALDIVGLRSDKTVRAYRQAWVWAIENGLAEIVSPGATVEIPEGVSFPPTGIWSRGSDEYDDEYVAEAEKAGVSFNVAKRAGATPAAIKAAIKADPNIEQAAWEAIQEKEAEKSEERRQRTGGRITCDTSSKDSLEGTELGSMMDGAIEETGRRDTIHELLSMSQQIRDLVETLKAEHNHTGVSDEVDWVHQISHNLSEAQWALASFTVEEVK